MNNSCGILSQHGLYAADSMPVFDQDQSTRQISGSATPCRAANRHMRRYAA
jgi:hypothetical protein